VAPTINLSNIPYGSNGVDSSFRFWTGVG
jgi:hypothetical protein